MLGVSNVYSLCTWILPFLTLNEISLTKQKIYSFPFLYYLGFCVLCKKEQATNNALLFLENVKESSSCQCIKLSIKCMFVSKETLWDGGNNIIMFALCNVSKILLLTVCL